MKVPLSWLRWYVDPGVTAPQVAERLTMGGLEVESLQHLVPPFRGVRVALVRRVRRHPGADRLLVCEVEADRHYEVVCGAPNVFEGALVALAAEGARLPRLGTVRARAIRGVLSAGMICSEAELGLGEDQEGVLLLDASLQPGEDLAACLEDWVLDVGVTPNRPDCLSVLGVAREVAALFDRELRPPAPPPLREERPGVAELVSLQVADEAVCRRYCARVVRGVRPDVSPFWMRRQLQLSGLRPINLLVDVTNWVMLERGQPLHAFDLQRLRGGAVVVRAAREGERLRLLDGSERPLPPGAPLVCDAAGPVALGGIMGGEGSAVGGDTREVLLEGAWFPPTAVRRAARALGIVTESSYRFERGVDPEGARTALDRAAGLLQELAGGRVARGVLEFRSEGLPRPAEVVLRPGRLERLLGTGVPHPASLLRRLGFEVREEREGLRVIPPSFRLDVAEEADLIEEVARLHGYDRIPARLPATGLPPRPLPPALQVEGRLRELLCAQGLHEVITYPFCPRPSPARMGLLPPEAAPLRLANPLRAEEPWLRMDLLGGLLEVARRNLRRSAASAVRVFELGRVFARLEGHVLERRHLGVLLQGPRGGAAHWSLPGEGCDFYDLKGVAEAVLERLGVGELELRPCGAEGLHPGKRAGLWAGGELLGTAGEVHPDLLEGLELPTCLAMELDLEALARRIPREVRAAVPPAHPPLVRDLSLSAPEDLPAAQLEASFRRRFAEIAPPGVRLEEMRLFDLYRGAPLPPDRKALTYRLRLQAEDRTLTDEEAAECLQRVLQDLQRELGVSPRG